MATSNAFIRLYPSPARPGFPPRAPFVLRVVGVERPGSPPRAPFVLRVVGVARPGSPPRAPFVLRWLGWKGRGPHHARFLFCARRWKAALFLANCPKK